MKQALPVIVGAAIGGTVGYFAVSTILKPGFYGLVIPGGFLGIGAALARRERSILLAILCGMAALILGFFTEWRSPAFHVDESLQYFVLHVHKLRPLALLMIALGGIVGFWGPYGGDERRRIPGSGGRA